jgi:PPP family 3-phenylpropionic acid transporter
MPLFAGISLIYTFVFALTGAYVQFFPVFLESRGFTSVQVSQTLTMVAFSKIFIGPIMAFYMKDNSKIKDYLLYASLLVGGFLFSLLYVYHISYIMLIALAIGCVFSVCIPLSESYGVIGTKIDPKLNYGHMRLFGTISFMLSGMMLGSLIDSNGTTAILPYLTIAAFLIGVFAILSPRIKSANGEDHVSVKDILSLFKNKMFLLTVFGFSIAHAGHTFNFSFGAIHWINLGFSNTQVAFFWTVACIAETIFFLFTNTIYRFFSIKTLFWISIAAGAIRWYGLSLDPNFYTVVVLQTLHAFTFAAGHLAIVRYIRDFIPHNLQNVAQLLYGSILWGVAYAPAVSITGYLYDNFHGEAYRFMLFYSLMGAIMVFYFKPQKAMP